MLSASRRLRTKEVEEIIKRGVPARGVFVTAKAIVGDTINVRAAAVVSKKIARSAVERNRLRRALYRAVAEVKLPSLQSSHAEGGVTTSLNIVFFIRSIPPNPLLPAFSKDVTNIIDSIKTIR